MYFVFTYFSDNEYLLRPVPISGFPCFAFNRADTEMLVERVDIEGDSDQVTIFAGKDALDALKAWAIENGVGLPRLRMLAGDPVFSPSLRAMNMYDYDAFRSEVSDNYPTVPFDPTQHVSTITDSSVNTQYIVYVRGFMAAY